MDWLYYLLEANLYLLIFYSFYRLFLQRETFYNSNRYYLLLSSITAFILPILQLGFLNPTPQVVDSALAFPAPVIYTAAEFANRANVPISATIDYSTYLYPIYLIICCFFVLKLVLSLSKIIRLWLTAKKDRRGTFTIVELEKEHSAFSFFNLLFIHPQLAAKQTVLKHEMVHIKQKHSLDILFFEIIQIICWFNPAIYFIKKDIKLLHEYIADELTTNNDIQKHDYAMFLIENSFGVVPTPLTNQIFNQSILKRRINMLNKKRTAGWARLRLLLVLPLGGAMLCTSTMAFTKDYGYIDLLPEKSLSTTTQEVPKVENIKKKAEPKVENIKKDQVKFPPPIVKNDRFTPIYAKDKKTGKPVLREKRLILINGKAVENLATFYGVYDADNVRYRMKSDAEAEYGDKGKYGAVEITGKNIKYYTKVTYPSPPPVEPPPPRQDYFTPNLVKDKKTGKYVPNEKRYIVINGTPINDNRTFYGVVKAEHVKILYSALAIKKYGAEKGKNGAVEITGSNLYFNKQGDQIKFPPPPKEDQVKFPPPIVKPDKTYFYPNRTVDKEGNINGIDKRYIVINSKKVEDITTFFGVIDASRINHLNGPNAIKKYGKGAKYGAVEISGDNIKYVKSIADGPPPPVMEQVKFPPPIVKPDKDLKKTSNPQTSLKKNAKINERENVIASLKSETNAKVNQLVFNVK